MKAREEHQVPLSNAALKVVVRPDRRKRSHGFVFRSQHGGQLSNMSMAQLMKRMGYGHVTVHGFRSTFRDWAGEKTDFERETIEMALAHAIGSKAEQAYRRARAIEKRRDLMQAWANFAVGQK